MGRTSGPRRVAAAVVLAVVWLLASAGPAAAHAVLVRAVPSDGSSRSQTPPALILSFDEDVLLSTAEVTLSSAGGQVITLPAARPASGRADETEVSTELSWTLPALPRGTYRAAWQVRSADDLHASSGTVVFGVGAAAAALPVDRSGPVPSAAAVSLRWLQLAALALLFGAAVVALLVLPRAGWSAASRATASRQLATVAGTAAVVAALVGLALLVQNATGGTGLGVVLLGSGYGRSWLAEELSCTALALVVAGGLAGGWSRARLAGGQLCALVALTAVAASGHVGNGSGRPLAVALLTLHLAAGLAWAGGLPVLALLAAQARRHGDPSRARALLRAFGIPAAAALGLLVVTGVALTSRQVASVDALLTTTYGQVLLAKAALVGLAALLGLRAHRALRRDQVTAAPPRPRLGLEVALLAAALLGAATLAAGTPARGPAFAATDTGGPTSHAAQVQDLFESIDLAPDQVGQSWLRVTVAQTRRPEPGPVTGVDVTLTDPGGTALPTHELAAATTQGWEWPGVDLTASGAWGIQTVVHRAGRPDAVWRTSWTVTGGPAARRTPVLSDKPWSAGLDTLALLLTGLLAGAAPVAARRRGRASAPEPQTPAGATPPEHADTDDVVIV